MSSFGDKAKSVIASVAPTLGTVLGGPLGGLAGAALAKALGTEDPKLQEQAIAAASPETLLKLKEAENELQEHLRQLDIDEQKLRFDDTANARAREIAVKDYTPRIIAYGVLAATFFLEGYLVIRGMPTLDAQMAIIVGRVLGTFDTASALVLGYYFGTSSGSAAKTDAINSIAVSKSTK